MNRINPSVLRSAVGSSFVLVCIGACSTSLEIDPASSDATQTQASSPVSELAAGGASGGTGPGAPSLSPAGAGNAVGPAIMVTSSGGADGSSVGGTASIVNTLAAGGGTGGSASLGAAGAEPSVQAEALGGAGGTPAVVPSNVGGAGTVVGGGANTATAGAAAVNVGGSAGASNVEMEVVVSPVADGEETITAPYNSPPEASRQDGVPRAKLESYVFAPGPTSIFADHNSRDVKVFIPAQYVEGTPVPFMVVLDGNEQLDSFKVDIVLENLIHERRLPVMAAIFTHNPDNFGSQRSVEYDSLGDDNVRFIVEEIIPFVEERHPELVLTEDPDGRGVLGKSSGGIGAFTMGWERPEQFRRLLTLNGSFVNIRGGDAYPDLIRSTPAKPLRVLLFSGSTDNNGFADGNQAVADALSEQGYEYRYVFGEGAGHGNNFGASIIADSLLWIWAGYPIGSL